MLNMTKRVKIYYKIHHFGINSGLDMKQKEEIERDIYP